MTLTFQSPQPAASIVSLRGSFSPNTLLSWSPLLPSPPVGSCAQSLSFDVHDGDSPSAPGHAPSDVLGSLVHATAVGEL